MSGSLNKVMLIGNLGAEPEIRNTQSGDKVATFSLATTESWKNQQGEKQERTEWHRVVVFGGLAKVVESYVSKGTKLLIEGQLRTRSWEDQSGQKRYTTEVVVSGFGTNLVMLGGGNSQSGGGYQNNNQSNNQPFGGASQSSNDAFGSASNQSGMQSGGFSDLDDDIPF